MLTAEIGVRCGIYETGAKSELAERLQQAGYSVTQATISRDIRELKLTKVSVGDGPRQKYTLLQEEANLYQKYVRVLQDGLISLEQAENLLVIKTISGMAMAVRRRSTNWRFPVWSGRSPGMIR